MVTSQSSWPWLKPRRKLPHSLRGISRLFTARSFHRRRQSKRESRQREDPFGSLRASAIDPLGDAGPVCQDGFGSSQIDDVEDVLAGGSGFEQGTEVPRAAIDVRVDLEKDRAVRLAPEQDRLVGDLDGSADRNPREKVGG